MVVLTREIILELIRKGEIKISPFEESQVGPASIDLHLGNKFRVLKKFREPLKVSEETYKEATELVELEKDTSFLLMPGELVQAVTMEEIELPSYLCGWIEGRSTLARVGLLTHLSSGFVHPGSKGKISITVLNFSSTPVSLPPGLKICQLILERVEGEARYAGKFFGQQAP